MPCRPSSGDAADVDRQRARLSASSILSLTTRPSTLTVSSSRWPRASRRGTSEVTISAPLRRLGAATRTTTACSRLRRRSRLVVPASGSTSTVDRESNCTRVRDRAALARASAPGPAPAASDRPPTSKGRRDRRAGDVDFERAQAGIVRQHGAPRDEQSAMRISGPGLRRARCGRCVHGCSVRVRAAVQRRRRVREHLVVGDVVAVDVVARRVRRSSAG